MIKNIWKKILAAGLAASLLVPSAAYANTQTLSIKDTKTIAVSEETSEEKDSSETTDLYLYDDQKEPWLNAIRLAAGIIIDIIEEKGLLDTGLTSEGYDNLRKIVDDITSPETLKDSLSNFSDTALTLAVQLAINYLTPYCIELADYLDSIGIGSDEIIELADLIPEEYKTIVDDILAYSGIIGLTDPNDTVMPLINKDADSTWAIYLYAAGNDLETQHWAVTHDLEEIMQTILPENVKVVIETGGSKYVHNEYMDSDYQNRCVYDSEGMHVISQTDRQNMGDQKTLESFLDWCRSDYPADNTMLIFWGHGAATDGVCLDENYNQDSLTLKEIENAVDNVYGKDRSKPVFDVVGFDACLMATAETASVCSRFASYLAASEETEPGSGWAYHSILSQIAATPHLTMKQLGTLLCSSFLFNNAVNDNDDECTFSYVDLSKVNELTDAYDDLGKAILERYREDPSIKDEIFHLAADAETYGAMFGIRTGNQIDLGDFASYLQTLFPEESEKVLEALKDCVLYMDNGNERDHSRGLSCTFPFYTVGESLTFYKEVAASESFLTYFEEAGYFTQEDRES